MRVVTCRTDYDYLTALPTNRQPSQSVLSGRRLGSSVELVARLFLTTGVWIMMTRL